MSDKNILNSPIETIGNMKSDISSKYDNHIKEKAIKKVDELLQLHKLKAEDIEPDDYEAMVSDAISEIKKGYVSKAATVGFSLLGLDLLLGW